MAPDPTAAYRKQQGMSTVTHSYDPQVVGMITKASAQTGADPAALLATALQESGARRGAVGDNGTSFGVFQFHRGGALGSHNAEWANSYDSVLNRAQEFAKGGVHHGKGAAAVQRPLDQSLYAQGVDKYMQQARAILGQQQAAPAAPKTKAPAIPAAPSIQTADHADIGTSLIQSLIDANSANAGISSIQLPVATPIAPRPTPAPVHVDKTARGTGPVDQKGAAIVEVARRYLGTAYKWGGASPKTGFDCSGLLQWAAAQSGIKIPRTTYEQVKAGTPVNPAHLQPGDAVFFAKGSDVHHVGIFIGGGKFLEAPHTGAVVRISTLANRKDFIAARRYA